MSRIRYHNEKAYLAQKRAFDLVLGSLLLIGVAPVFLIVALAIKLSSPGPVFFRQMRVGLNGKLFGYLKFRTMRVEAPELSTGPVFQLASDPRLTRLGVFLRRTAIDELPALFNVISGDMSIVGPRAALSLEVEHYSEKQRERLKLKPGLTGYWQVFGREQEKFTFDEMVAMDLEYLDKHSLLLDLRILARTFVMALRSRSAY